MVVFIKFYWNTAMTIPFTHCLDCILQWQSLVIETETLWAAKPKIFSLVLTDHSLPIVGIEGASGRAQ